MQSLADISFLVHFHASVDVFLFVLAPEFPSTSRAQGRRERGRVQINRDSTWQILPARTQLDRSRSMSKNSQLGEIGSANFHHFSSNVNEFEVGSDRRRVNDSLEYGFVFVDPQPREGFGFRWQLIGNFLRRHYEGFVRSSFLCSLLRFTRIHRRWCAESADVWLCL